MNINIEKKIEMCNKINRFVVFFIAISEMLLYFSLTIYPLHTTDEYVYAMFSLLLPFVLAIVNLWFLNFKYVEELLPLEDKSPIKRWRLFHRKLLKILIGR